MGPRAACTASGRPETLVQVICERGAKVNKDTLAIMPYADAAIKEALRLGAIINIVPKKALKTFEIGGYTIPKASLRSHTPPQTFAKRKERKTKENNDYLNRRQLKDKKEKKNLDPPPRQCNSLALGGRDEQTGCAG